QATHEPSRPRGPRYNECASAAPIQGRPPTNQADLADPATMSSDLRSLLSDTVTRLFTDLATKELIEAAEKGTWPDKLWRALEEGGLTLPLVSEDAGGAGGTWLDAHVVIRAAGRYTAPVPIAETIVAAWLLSRAGLEVPFGPLTLAPVRRAERLGLTDGGGGVTVDGRVTRVPWGRDAGHVVTLGDLHGRPPVALIAGRAAAAGIAAEAAFRAAERGDARFEIAVAKVRVGEAAGVGAGIAHQTHGAIGFTYEHSLHFATRRLWSWRAEFGSESAWARELGHAVAARGADALWSDLTAR